MYSRFNNAPSHVFNSPSYISYVVEYQGSIEKDASVLSKEYYLTVINEKYAIVTFKYNSINESNFNNRNNIFPSIVYVSRYYLYTLQGIVKDSIQNIESISPVSASNIDIIQKMAPMKLKGKNVVVGLIGTGIDYLNEEFMYEDNRSRILSLWDQTITENGQSNVPFGKEFTNEQINNAINEFKNGGNPYNIVSSVDDLGNGTAMASLIGAGVNNRGVISAAPECSFVVVKLVRALVIEENLKGRVPVYDMASIMTALQYLYDYAIKNNVPMVIYLPLGTTLGNHRLNGILENFIDEICFNIGITVITGTGNEGEASNHVSGYINSAGQFRDVEFYVSQEQNYLRMELWADNPDTMSIELFSPSGESTGIIPAQMKKIETEKFIFEGSYGIVRYYLPDDLTGDELISIEFSKLQPGIWKCRVHGEYIVNGAFNMWMLQKDLLLNGTRFSTPDNYGTMTNPGPGRYSITVAAYNQNNFSIEPTSGMYFFDSEFNQIDVACGGVDVKSIGTKEAEVVINGTGAASAVVAGAAAILMQWAIVEKNEPYLYSETLKTYILRGTIKRPNDVYPNPQWGYGILDLLGVFRNIE